MSTPRHTTAQLSQSAREEERAIARRLQEAAIVEQRILEERFEEQFRRVVARINAALDVSAERARAAETGQPLSAKARAASLGIFVIR